MYIQVVLQAQEIMRPASASAGQQPSKPAAQVSGCCAAQRCRARHWHGIAPALHCFWCATVALPQQH